MSRFPNPRTFLYLCLLLSPAFLSGPLSAQSGGQDVFQKANNAINKATNAIAVFQPYLLKARQLFYDAKQMGGDMKRDAKRVFGKDSSGYNNGGSYSNNNSGSYNNNGGGPNSGTYNNNGGSPNSGTY